MKDFIKAMKALSDPNRVRIVKMLQYRSLCVCEIQAALEIAQPTVSKHLKILEEAGFVDYEKEGLWVNYHLSGDNPYSAAMLEKLRNWLENDSKMSKIIIELPHLNREIICKR
ncbi:MAG: winged helix-turn-helix transcriptional regulator [Desulfobacteraceae bacterium]|nr:winged helix-turn-helix transcriptional regulator [Desulfobacteraceae bacterium]